MSEVDQIRGYLAFTEDDLDANRNGEFSERQRQKYPEIEGGSSWFWVLLGTGALGAAVWLGYRAFTRGGDVSVWVLAVLLFAIAVWIYRGAFNENETTLAMVEGEVRFYEVTSQTGSITDSDFERDTIHSWDMMVGGIRFSNANPALKKYMEGGKYRVYFTSTTYQILSAEKIL